MAKKSSSGRWKQRQAKDPFVRRAQSEGWRSRAAFKLMEIDQRERLLRRGAIVLDLGAAPGGWSQLAVEKVGEAGQVLAVDMLDMEPLAGVQYIQGDFADEAVIERIEGAFAGKKADLVLSDMAPNITGNWSVDQPRSIYLAELVLQMSERLLRPGGSLVIKVFQGEGFDELTQGAKACFGAVRIRKPPASRAQSREMYLVAVNHRL
jgi:23S rRNA (uridine2552-2'-O)-methyltransferase